MTTGSGAFNVRGHTRKALVVHGPFGHLYARDFCLSVALQVFAVMALVESIFLAERFPMVFRDVLKNNADLLDTAMLFVLNSTQIFDLALALAILMAVYWTTLRMRENRELLVLFAAGTGPYQIAALILAVAVTAQIGSLVVSGLVDPASRYAQREILFNAEFRALRSGINTGQFYFFPNRVAFAPAQTKVRNGYTSSDQTQKLFVYEQIKTATFRVITADHARLDGPDRYGTILLKLLGFTSRTFSVAPPAANVTPSSAEGGRKLCADCRGQRGGVSQMTVSARDVTQEMTLDELLTFLPRGSKPEELTIFEQLEAKAGTTSLKRRQEMRLLGERFARSLLCLLAPLMALVSVCLTSRITNYLALPLACMALMALNVTSEWLIRAIVPTNPLEALAVPAALTAVFAALLLAEVINRQGELVRPQLARP
ncbi:MAG: LptF/LptG family permease [Alphaproteobacteria bacterium]|nr:LptF/LptG family permease [Alphaproteobacteria bacterium]MDE1985972.1 LptF/LptG family permease [Alphaproteobacteria bacterium]